MLFANAKTVFLHFFPIGRKKRSWDECYGTAGAFPLHVFQIVVIVGIQRIRTLIPFAVALGKKLAALRLLRKQQIAVFLQQRFDGRGQHLFILLEDRIQTGKKITGDQTGLFFRLILNSGISLRGGQIVQHDEIFLEKTHESQTISIFQVPLFNGVGIDVQFSVFAAKYQMKPP